mgnify:CR=1 FL=1
MTVNKLPRKTLLLWQIRLAIINIIVLAVCFYFRWGFSWILPLYIVFTALCLLLIFLYLPKYIQSYSIKLMGDTVIIDCGVIIKTTQIMPYSRLIYSQTFTSPLAYKMGITAVSLKAARSRIIIPEIKKEDAQELITAISKGEE